MDTALPDEPTSAAAVEVPAESTEAAPAMDAARASADAAANFQAPGQAEPEEPDGPADSGDGPNVSDDARAKGWQRM